MIDMFVPSKEDYCRARAKANTYDDIHIAYDSMSGVPREVCWRFFAEPEMYFEEYLNNGYVLWKNKPK